MRSLCDHRAHQDAAAYQEGGRYSVLAYCVLLIKKAHTDPILRANNLTLNLLCTFRSSMSTTKCARIGLASESKSHAKKVPCIVATAYTVASVGELKEPTVYQ